MCKMSKGLWCRAVWQEGEEEMEEVIPSSWIKDTCVMWPSGGVALRALKSRKEPADDWLKFNLIKIKFQSNDKKECVGFNETTTIEDSSEDDENTGTRINEKRVKKKKTYPDFIVESEKDGIHETSSTSRTEEEETSIPPKKVTENPIEGRVPVPPNKAGSQKRVPVPPKKVTEPQKVTDKRNLSKSRSRSPISKSMSQRSLISKSMSQRSHNPKSCRTVGSKSINDRISKSRSPRSDSMPQRSRSRSRRSESRSLFSDRRSSELTTHASSSRSHKSVSRSQGSLSRSRRSLSRSPWSLSRSQRSLSRSQRSLSRSQRSLSRSDRSNARSHRTLSRSRRSFSRSERSLSRSERSKSRYRYQRSMSRSHRSMSSCYRSMSRSRRSMSRQHSSMTVQRSSDRSRYRSRSPSQRTISRRSRSRSLCRPGKKEVFPMKDAKFQRKVLYLLVDIRDIIGAKDHGVSSYKEFLKAETITDFEALEKQLADDKERKHLRKYLIKIGGINGTDHTKKSMNRMMSNSVMAQMNMTGKMKKISFKETRLFKAIKDVVSSTHPTYTETDMWKDMTTYLKFAPERTGGGGRKGK